MEETKIVEEKALTIVDQAKLVKVTDSATYTAACQLWKDIGAMIKEVEGTFKPICEAAHKTWKTAVAKRDGFLDPLTAAQKSVKQLTGAYDAEEERKRKAEENRLAEISRKEAEERALAEAVALEQSGNKEEAEAIIETPVYVPPVIVQKTVLKMTGGPVYRTIWKFKITNAALIPKDYLIPDEVKIGGLVRAMKSATNIPGVQAYEERC